MHDLILAIVHHILVFGLFAMMVMQRGLLGAATVDVRRLSRLDMGTGITSGLVLLVGIGRVLGGKGWAFYEANPFFWTKIACFFLIGALTVPGTMAFLKWARARRADAGFQPPEDQVRGLHRLTGWQMLLFLPLLASAAAMARWPF